MPNHYNYGLKQAKKQFYKDLQIDVDFLEFKRKSKDVHGNHYGVVVAGFCNKPAGCLLNIYGPTSRKIISQFLKSLNH